MRGTKRFNDHALTRSSTIEVEDEEELPPY